MERVQIRVAPAKEKLFNLAAHSALAKDDEFVQAFGRFLAQRLGTRDIVYPEGFNVVCVLAIHDMRTGISGLGDHIPHGLLGMPDMLYAVLQEMTLPRLVDDIFSPEEAAAVHEVMAQVKKLEEEERSKQKARV